MDKVGIIAGHVCMRSRVCTVCIVWV